MDAIQTTVAYFCKGGLVMWPLLICSVLVISIAIERFLFYRTCDSGRKFAYEYAKIVRRQGIYQADEYAKKNTGRCAKILSETTCFAKVHHSVLAAHLESQAGIVIAELRSKLDYLGVIVTLSPLLGLLGTIVGMIGAFSIFDMQSGAPIAITGGIGEALIATATGLCVAIIALCVNSYFNHRLDYMITDMEQCFSALLEVHARGKNNETT